MAGFLFPDIPADDQPAAELPAAGEVALDAFWPAVNIVQIRAVIRLSDNVNSARLREATENALLSIASQLDCWRRAREAEGFDSLAEVPARRKLAGAGGRTDYEVLWARAVYSEVGADLAERQLNAGVTAAGIERIEQLQSDVEIHRRNVTFAVRDFLGISRVTAEAL
jgi:hypothetical protein